MFLLENESKRSHPVWLIAIVVSHLHCRKFQRFGWVKSLDRNLCHHNAQMSRSKVTPWIHWEYSAQVVHLCSAWLSSCLDCLEICHLHTHTIYRLTCLSSIKCVFEFNAAYNNIKQEVLCVTEEKFLRILKTPAAAQQVLAMRASALCLFKVQHRSECDISLEITWNHAKIQNFRINSNFTTSSQMKDSKQFLWLVYIPPKLEVWRC